MYKVVKEGKGGIVARIVADSVNAAGNRITTFELEYHRYIHGEVMTHRLFSRNAMSSRAVPIKKMIKQVKNSPATPIHWGKNQSGMQAKEECSNPVLLDCDGIIYKYERDEAWSYIASCVADFAESFEVAGYHKQIVNRLLEPFQMMKTVLTATEFENFFWLRLDADAQPEIQELAKCMYEAMKESEPELLSAGEWHTPYVEHQRCQVTGDLHYVSEVQGSDEKDNSVAKYLSKEEAISVSSSCCAQVSYRNIDNTYDKAMSVYERLGVGGSKIHASPFEHPATPMRKTFAEDCDEAGYEVFGDNHTEKGVTHLDRDLNYWSGNLKGWVQHRQLLSNHTK